MVQVVVDDGVAFKNARIRMFPAPPRIEIPILRRTNCNLLINSLCPNGAAIPLSTEGATRIESSAFVAPAVILVTVF